MHLEIWLQQALAGGLTAAKKFVLLPFVHGGKNSAVAESQADSVRRILKAGDKGADTLSGYFIAQLIKCVNRLRNFPTVGLEQAFVVKNPLYGTVDRKLVKPSAGAHGR